MCPEIIILILWPIRIEAGVLIRIVPPFLLGLGRFGLVFVMNLSLALGKIEHIVHIRWLGYL